MKNLIDQSGLVTESDYISLSRTLVMNKDYLVDKVIIARHKLHRKAVSTIDLLDQPIPFELWRQYGYRQKLDDNEIAELLVFLNGVGGLDIRRSLKGRFIIMHKNIKRLLMGQLPISRSRRWSPNFINTSRAVLQASLPLLVASLVTTLAAYVAGFDFMFVMVANGTFLFSIWVSTVMHEQMHNYVISKITPRRILIQRSLRLGLLYGHLPNNIELASAILGPCVGACSALILCLGLRTIFGQSYYLLEIGALVAAFQLVSLLPMYGDGRIVWNNLKGVI